MTRPRTGLILTCEHCKTEYYVPPVHAKSRFCSKACADAGQTGDRKTVACKKCGKKFLAKKDHGVWQKFCSKTCKNRDAPKPGWKECPTCGEKFFAERSSHSTPDGLRIYCSKKCSKEGLKNGFTKICINCGAEFYVNPSRARQRNEESCCSRKCQHEFYVNELCHSWKGGRYTDRTTGRIQVLQQRPGYVSPYMGEHRLIASRSIGRMLERHEFVIHVNNIKTDNRPANLFICGSNSEFSKRRQGSLPWPKKSNLEEYK